MARINVKTSNTTFTHEGAPAVPNLSIEKQLRRSVMSCLLWEDEFYEDGKTIADRISELAENLPVSTVAKIAIEARSEMHLRHVPLLLLEVISRTGSGNPLVAQTIAKVIQRPDELGEFLAIYTHGGDRRVAKEGHGRKFSAQVRKGLALAFAKFGENGLAKYDRDGKVKMRDVLRIAHPKPEGEGRSELYKRVRDRTLVTPDTWETNLSKGADKKETFERLIREKSLGYFALLRNLRNMAQTGVDAELVNEAIIARKNGAERILPFRYVAAARAAPQFEPSLDKALCAAIEELPIFDGLTFVLVDVSGSMDFAMSGKSDMTRIDAGAALASMVTGNLRMFTFSEHLVEVPARRGMAGVDAIRNSQAHGGTRLGEAVTLLQKMPHDRLIVVTDEQSSDPVPQPIAKHAYMINVASNKNGVGYGRWNHINGWSDSILRYIHEIEKQDRF